MTTFVKQLNCYNSTLFNQIHSRLCAMRLVDFLMFRCATSEFDRTRTCTVTQCSAYCRSTSSTRRSLRSSGSGYSSSASSPSSVSYTGSVSSPAGRHSTATSVDNSAAASHWVLPPTSPLPPSVWHRLNPAPRPTCAGLPTCTCAATGFSYCDWCREMPATWSLSSFLLNYGTHTASRTVMFCIRPPATPVVLKVSEVCWRRPGKHRRPVMRMTCKLQTGSDHRNLKKSNNDTTRGFRLKTRNSSDLALDCCQPANVWFTFIVSGASSVNPARVPVVGLRCNVNMTISSIGILFDSVNNDTELKITTNFSGDVNFLRAFHLKFTVNANFVYSPVEATFSTSIVCPNHYSQYFNENGISLSLCPDFDPN